MELILEQQPKHELQPNLLLWSLLFLKLYGTKEFHSNISNVTCKTFRFWSWAAIEVIPELKLLHYGAVTINFLVSKLIKFI